jgi:RNA polymerase sigma-70 factor (ECF subfamily)
MLPAAADVARLIELVASGDRVAFRQLYKSTSANLFGVALRILNNRSDADEVLQEIYLKIWISAAYYQRSAYSPIGWLVVIARNKSIDAIRMRRVAWHAIEDAGGISDSAPSPEQAAITSDQRRRLAVSLNRMLPHKAGLLRDAYLVGKTYRELALQHGIPLNTVRIWLRRGLIELGEQMSTDTLAEPQRLQLQATCR